MTMTSSGTLKRDSSFLPLGSTATTHESSGATRKAGVCPCSARALRGEHGQGAVLSIVVQGCVQVTYCLVLTTQPKGL